MRNDPRQIGATITRARKSWDVDRGQQVVQKATPSTIYLGDPGKNRTFPFLPCTVSGLIHDAFLTTRSRVDPLVSHGRHFGRTVHAFCRPFPLIKEGLARQLQLQAEVLNEDDLSEQWVSFIRIFLPCALLITLQYTREHREHGIFQALLAISPGLDTRLLRASADELHYVAEMVRSHSFACFRPSSHKPQDQQRCHWSTR